MEQFFIYLSVITSGTVAVLILGWLFKNIGRLLGKLAIVRNTGNVVVNILMVPVFIIEFIFIKVLPVVVIIGLGLAWYGFLLGSVLGFIIVLVFAPVLLTLPLSMLEAQIMGRKLNI